MLAIFVATWIDTYVSDTGVYYHYIILYYIILLLPGTRLLVATYKTESL